MIATVIADGVSAVLIIYFLMNEEETIRLRLNKLKIKKSELIKSYQNRCTGGLQGVVFSISNVCIQTAINNFSSDCCQLQKLYRIEFQIFYIFLRLALYKGSKHLQSQITVQKILKRCKKRYSYDFKCGYMRFDECYICCVA